MSVPAAFLDRDGTLIADLGYLGDPAGVQLLDGAAAAVGALQRAGYRVVLVSNQSGVGRGLFAEAAVHQVNARLCALLLAADADARIDACYHCPHAPGAGCDCRKPLPGLFLRAAREHDLALARSLAFGDKERDVEAARAAGCRDAWRVGEGCERTLYDAVQAALGAVTAPANDDDHAR